MNSSHWIFSIRNKSLMEAHPLLTDIEKIKCEKDVSTRIALQLNFSVWESPADGSLTPLCHRSTLKESRAGNAVAAIVCGNVRAILYPFEKILRRQQKFFIRGCFLLLPGIPHQRLITRGCWDLCSISTSKGAKAVFKIFHEQAQEERVWSEDLCRV